MNLTGLSFTPKNITKGLDIIRQMKSLKVIGIGDAKSFSPAEFWKKYDAGEFGKPDAPEPSSPTSTPPSSNGSKNASPACREADRSRQQEVDGVESGV